MKLKIYLFAFSYVSIFFLNYPLAAQSLKITGRVQDARSKEPLVGVNVFLKNKLAGTSTDAEGNFTLKTDVPLPFVLVFSSMGFRAFEMTLSQASTTDLLIELEEENLLGKEIVVAASRIEESRLESPVSIERMGVTAIQALAATNFYEGLRNLKGVDMGQQSLLFSTPNTRGFNDNTNYRVSQYIDGVDNAAPGLNFSAGNLVGASQLDIESVELLVGASSALYGAGGVNGTILMTTKSPFEYQGLSLSMQTGMMHLGASYRDNPRALYDANLRYAKAFNNRFAFKINLSYLNALDWHATDYRDNNNLSIGNTSHLDNPAYDGVNTYGDEALFPVNIAEFAPQTADGVARSQGLVPGSAEYDEVFNQVISLFPERQIVTRTGYLERDLADYNTYSFKGNASLHYRFGNDLELVAQGGIGQGTSVYTASNRFSLNKFTLFNAKLELKSEKFFVRAWLVGENAGDSYDIGTTALQINEAWKSSEQWYEDYLTSFTQNRLLGNPMDVSLLVARFFADNRDFNGNVQNPNLPFRPFPGEAQFDALFSELTSRPLTDEFSINGNSVRGTRVIDRSQMYNIEGMYNFGDYFRFAEVMIGFSHRIYRINSEGTIFGDAPGDPHIITETGAYLQLIRKIFKEKVRFIATARYDKNSNFDARLTPRISAVYSLDPAQQHFLRASVQSAFRFPSMADQYTDLNVGIFRVIGGLPQFRNALNITDNPVYPLDNPSPIIGNPDTSQEPLQFPDFRPERVTAWEVGYKGLFAEKIFVDAYMYYNVYNGFIASQAFGRFRADGTPEKFLSAISQDEPVQAYGWAVGLEYGLPKGYWLNANIAYNALNVGEVPPSFQTRFNTPDYRCNVSFSNREVVKNVGFNVVWRWQNSFFWESIFGVGEIPAYQTIDAQVSYKFSKLKTILKLGASNLFNQYYTTGFGNPEIGGIYYIQLSFDELMR